MSLLLQSPFSVEISRWIHRVGPTTFCHDNIPISRQSFELVAFCIL